MSQASIAEALMLMTGKAGAVLVKDTAVHTGPFRRLAALADPTLATITLNGVDYTTITMNSGTEIYGNIASFSLSSGHLIAYK